MSIITKVCILIFIIINNQQSGIHIGILSSVEGLEIIFRVKMRILISY